MRKIPCTYMRGGTSKACVFQRENLPENKEEWKEIFLKVMGTPDAKQIDGMGGTVTSTSKIAVISKSGRKDADVDYEFFQVLIDKPIVISNMNCGNISSTVGPYAVDEGLVAVTEPITTVRIFNINTGKLMEETVRIQDGKAAVSGDAAIPGVPGTGSPVEVFFKNPTGAVTGNAFPTGNKTDHLEIPGYDSIDATIFDCVNPVVFIRAFDIGLSGSENVEVNSQPEILARVERIRAVCAEKMGMATSYKKAEGKGVGPLIALVSKPQPYTDFDGNGIEEAAMDICCRGFNGGKMHRAYPMSLAAATAAASQIKGTLPSEMCSGGLEVVRLGHAGGVTDVKVCLKGDNQVEKIGLVRTARRIMDGYVYIAD